MSLGVVTKNMREPQITKIYTNSPYGHEKVPGIEDWLDVEVQLAQQTKDLTGISKKADTHLYLIVTLRLREGGDVLVVEDRHRGEE